MSAIIPSDRGRIEAILARTRKNRQAKGRLILGLETVSRLATVNPWMTDPGYQTQVLVGRPVVISPWLTHHDAIKEFGQHCRANGITKIADVARHAIETVDRYPGEQITLMIVGDCFDEDQDRNLQPSTGTQGPWRAGDHGAGRSACPTGRGGLSRICSSD